jgi:hypothetical protein
MPAVLRLGSALRPGDVILRLGGNDGRWTVLSVPKVKGRSAFVQLDPAVAYPLTADDLFPIEPGR